MKRAAVTIALLASALAQGPSRPVETPKPEPAAGSVFKIDRYPKDPEPAAAPKPEDVKPNVLTYEGKPLKLPFECTEADIAGFGMTCTEQDPCPVFLELASLQPLGQRIFATGNLHNGSSTMFSILLASDDAGKTWREGFERVRSGGLDQIQFFDFESGWISGQILLAMPRDPFFLITTDGGKNWRKRAVFSETRVAAIEQFSFDTKTQGNLIIDRTQGAETPRYEHHESMTGGESWTVREVSGRALRLKSVKPSANADWRLDADAKLKAHRIQKKEGAKWSTVVMFNVSVGECRPAPSVLSEPPPPPEPKVQTPPAPVRRPTGRPSLKKGK
ncbi:MAG: hypothetical protein FJW39_30340 [Acidobacteria bacterium]|nr:hypothetical protein [Acidobacteriota bacterium]